MIPEQNKQALLTFLGVSAGVATGLWLWRRGQAPQEAYAPVGPSGWTPPLGAGAEVADALRNDRSLARRAIEVDSISDGVIELTGEVETRAEARRAVAIAQGARGVYTVVNRLTLREEESHLDETQQRRENGDPALMERHHYGMGVGMGTRRQSPDTDPDRPSDKQKILDRELDVANVEDAPEGGPNPVSGDDAVESSRVKPGDEMAIEDAGLDPSPRPTSTPKDSATGEATTEEGERT